MNKYESIIIVNPKLNEKQQNEIENKYKKIINKNGNVISIENIGKKRLAYEIPTKLEIVGVKYEDKFKKQTFSGREYSYYSDIKDINVGDVVEVPTRYGKSVAQVVRTNIDEKEIEKIKDYMKIIIKRIDKEEFFSKGENE